MAIAPSTYYAHRTRPVSATDWVDAHAANALLDLWRDNFGVYGIEKYWAAMRRGGHDIGRDQVARLIPKRWRELRRRPGRRYRPHLDRILI